MAPPFKLKHDDRLFGRVAVGEPLRRVALGYGIDASIVSGFIRGAGAEQLAAGRVRASERRREPSALEPGRERGGRVTPRRDGLAEHFDRHDAEREAGVAQPGPVRLWSPDWSVRKWHYDGEIGVALVAGWTYERERGS